MRGECAFVFCRRLLKIADHLPGGLDFRIDLALGQTQVWIIIRRMALFLQRDEGAGEIPGQAAGIEPNALFSSQAFFANPWSIER